MESIILRIAPCVALDFQTNELAKRLLIRLLSLRMKKSSLANFVRIPSAILLIALEFTSLVPFLAEGGTTPGPFSIHATQCISRHTESAP